MTEDQFTTKRLGLGYYQVLLKGTSAFVFNVIEQCRIEGIELFEEWPLEYGLNPLDMQGVSDSLWVDQGMVNRNSFSFIAHEDTVALMKLRF